mmetsp:Transcript_18446/g.39903  ORF Transcript_18446/g.39903 Transcript_18446/m.39903 type:complete len:635 (+) Transcript_18446:99-2003(+)
MASTTTTTASYTFAVVPKRTNSPYWQVVKTGCEIRAQRLTKELNNVNVTCLFIGPPEGGPETEANQAEIVEDIIDGKYGTIDGLALAVVGTSTAEPLIEKAAEKGIHTVTFDTDAPNSQRLAYIGTDNVAMGRELGRVLLQIDSEGGTYGLIGAGGGSIALRLQGVRESLDNSKWVEVADSPKDCGGNNTLAVAQMLELVQANPHLGAIIPVGAWPMNEPQLWQDFVDENSNVITVVGDSLPGQIDLMRMGYANALVGQLPFEMGRIAIDRLMEVRTSLEAGLGLPFENEIFPTSFLDVVNIPQDLPPMVIDMNYIGSWAIFGYILLGIIFLLSIGFGLSTIIKRKHPIIRKSQPTFLLMVCAGAVIAGSAIIPMSFDDEKYSIQACSIACMATPWLTSIGFVTAFSALFSKIWRVNKIFHNPNRFSRIKVTEKDVLAPFASLMTINIITLICWSVINPLVYERLSSSGTDFWNREYTSFYGTCVSSTEAKGGSLPYKIILVITNCVSVIIANVQAYEARHIDVEFQESKYIALATASFLQAFMIGIPVIILLKEDPRAIFIVTSMLIFITSMAVLLLLFVPKLKYLRAYETKQAAKKSRQDDRVRLNTDSDHLKFKVMESKRILNVVHEGADE